MSGQHEKTDMNPTYVLYFLLALVAAGVVIHAGLWWMFHRFEQSEARREAPRTLVNIESPKPEPRLQISPQDDLAKMRQNEEEILTTYGWIDKEKGIARIPLERAMQLFLEKQKR